MKYQKPFNGEFKLTSGFKPSNRPTHRGVDWAMPIGTDLFAVVDGRILRNAVDRFGGKWTDLAGNDGRMYRYLHLSRFIAKQGSSVKVGDVIAKSGNTGNSTGPHLHFEEAISIDGDRIDPIQNLFKRVENQSKPKPDDGKRYITMKPGRGVAWLALEAGYPSHNNHNNPDGNEFIYDRIAKLNGKANRHEFRLAANARYEVDKDPAKWVRDYKAKQEKPKEEPKKPEPTPIIINDDKQRIKDLSHDLAVCDTYTKELIDDLEASEVLVSFYKENEKGFEAKIEDLGAKLSVANATIRDRELKLKQPGNKQKFDFDKFLIGLSKFGVDQAILVGAILSGLSYFIDYIELLPSEQTAGWVIPSAVILAGLKAVYQSTKNLKQTK